VPRFYDPAFLEDDDLVGVADRAEAVAMTMLVRCCIILLMASCTSRSLSVSREELLRPG